MVPGPSFWGVKKNEDPQVVRLVQPDPETKEGAGMMVSWLVVCALVCG